MAIIRNDRSKRTESEPKPTSAAEVEPEEEIDYSWHPNEDEFVSPLTAEQWSELLEDDDFAQSDAGRAVRCLREYGEPATFQQLSIRYRGTMGRYRRWLAEAARAAGERFGIPAPQRDQFGMDEWWPLLYQTRNAGKPGAGIFEMALRPEVEEAFLRLEEKERQAKRAENARQLQRIEQLERARQEERRRAAAPVQETTPQQDAKPTPRAAQAEDARPVRPAMADSSRDAAGEVESAALPAFVEAQPATQPKAQPTRVATDGVAVPMRRFKPVEEAGALRAASDEAPEELVPVLPATMAYVRLMEEKRPAGGTRFVATGEVEATDAGDVAAPIDYALRYAERLRYAFVLMGAGVPSLTLASVARELGDPSVERLQGIVNGQTIPDFAYLDTLRERLYVGVERLEAPEGREDGLPTFVTLCEASGVDGVGEVLSNEGPIEISYVVDDSDDRRTGVIVRFSDVRCTLLTRGVVRGAARRADNPELEAFIRMVDELDGFARARNVLRTSRQVSAETWDELVAGRIWPGSLLR